MISCRTPRNEQRGLPRGSSDFPAAVHRHDPTAARMTTLPRRHILSARTAGTLAGALLLGLLAALPASGVRMANDPKGFHGIAWGTPLAEHPDFSLVAPGDRITEYELKTDPALLGPVEVDSVRFVTLNGKFARVKARYKGSAVHEQLLAYFQTLYGPLDKTPGQTMVGPNEQYTWRGTVTEVNVTYQSGMERGFVFIESYALAQKFNELMGDTIN